jgi:hypothetical protein
MSVAPEHMQKKTPAEQLEALVAKFETANKTATDNPGQVLRDLITTSPALKQQLEDAVSKGELTEFKGLPPGTNAGGQYSGTTMEIPIAKLNKAATDKAAANEVVFVLGHETRHGLNNPAEKVAGEAFNKSLESIAKVKGGKHDYTAAVEGYIQHYRDNEAQAHLSGWNALSSKLAKEKGANPTLQDMYDAAPGRMQDFIDRTGTAPKFSYAMKAGLTVDKDMQLPLDAANVKAMGGYYFDKPLSKGSLGAAGNQNYPNYYGDYALNRVQAYEKAYTEHFKKTDAAYTGAEVQVDLGKLGLSKTVLTTGLTYTDTTAPKKPIEQGVGGAEPSLYTQAASALQKLDGAPQGTELRNVAAAMALQAQKDGITGIDGVVRGSNGNLIAYQGDPSQDHARRATVDQAQAKDAPAEKSLSDLGQLQQQAPQREAQAQTQRAVGM